MPFLPDDAQDTLSGRFSSRLSRVMQSSWIRDCRTYYRFALFAMSITVFLNALILILSIVKFAIFDFISFSFSTLFCGVLAAAIHYLLKYSNMPESDHWLTDAQTHILASSAISFIMISYGSSLHRPWSSPLRVCLSSNTKGFIGNMRCQLVLIIDYLVWVAPLAMFIAGCLVYFNAIAVTRQASAERGWRRVNVAQGHEPTGELSLPYDSITPLLSNIPGPYEV